MPGPALGCGTAPVSWPCPRPSSPSSRWMTFCAGAVCVAISGSQGVDLAGARRSAGCAACHRPRDGAGKPLKVGHNLTRQVPVSQCLTCHAGCGAGAEYAGRIPRDARQGARFLADNPLRPTLWQGRDWRPMQPDLHFSAGLACQDCHTRPEIMGDGRLRPAALLQVGVRCTTCHGRAGQIPDQAKSLWGVPLKHVTHGPDGLVLIGKMDGKTRPIPSLAGGPKGAGGSPGLPQHEKVACHACHSATNPAAWGLQVLLETRPDFRRWQGLAAQGDPQGVGPFVQPPAHPPRPRPCPPPAVIICPASCAPGCGSSPPFGGVLNGRCSAGGPRTAPSYWLPAFNMWLPAWTPKASRWSRPPSPPRPAAAPAWAWRLGTPIPPKKATLGCAGCHGRARALGLGLTFISPEPRMKTEPAAPASPGPPRPPPAWPRACGSPGKRGLTLSGDWTRVWWTWMASPGSASRAGQQSLWQGTTALFVGSGQGIHPLAAQGL